MNYKNAEKITDGLDFIGIGGLIAGVGTLAGPAAPVFWAIGAAVASYGLYKSGSGLINKFFENQDKKEVQSQASDNEKPASKKWDFIKIIKNALKIKSLTPTISSSQTQTDDHARSQEDRSIPSNRRTPRRPSVNDLATLLATSFQEGVFKCTTGPGSGGAVLIEKAEGGSRTYQLPKALVPEGVKKGDFIQLTRDHNHGVSVKRLTSEELQLVEQRNLQRSSSRSSNGQSH